MRRGVLGMLAMLVVWGLIAAPLAADTVFTRDNRIIRGTATRSGDVVIIDTGTKTIRIPAKDVLHITKTSGTTAPPTPTTPVVPSPGTGTPVAPTLPAGTSKALTVSDLPIHVPTRIFSMDSCYNPEPPLFMLMRGRGVISVLAGSESARQIENWQSLIHERRRKVNNKWIKPEDFVRHRQQFAKNLDAAREAERKHREAEKKRSSRYGGSSSYSPRTSSKDDRIPAVVVGKLLQAANSWADPTLRTFLGAMANYQAERYTQAASMFRTCCVEQPRVAGYWQGYALCMNKLKEHKQSLSAALQVLRLRPDERTAAQLVYEMMGSAPGAIARTDLYAEAEKMMEVYGDSVRKSSSSSYRTYSRSGTTWIMPGRSMRALRNSLPTPSYDRLRFKQAVGVPISASSLLLDAKAVTDSMQLHVQVSPTLVVPAKVRRVTSFSSRSKTAGPPLMLATVEGYTFTPVAFDPKKVAPAKDMHVVAYSLGLHEEMGHRVLQVPGKVVSAAADGTVTVSCKLLSGDAAGPVLTRTGQLVGFLQGKADPRATGGGPDKLFSTAQMAELLERSTRSTRTYGSSRSSRSRQKAEPIPVPGQTFVVYATFAETLQPAAK